MPRSQKPFIVSKRKDAKTFFLTLNSTSGLPERVCGEWNRKSFQNLPPDLMLHSSPKTRAAAEAGALVLIAYLKKKLDDGNVQRLSKDDITVGAWIEKFTSIDTSPRTGLNASKNRPYSLDTISGYKSYFDCHIKDDPLTKIKMTEVEEEDVLEFISRLSIKKNGNKSMGGTRTFAGVIIFIRMTFKEYQRRNRKWFNPFEYMYPPRQNSETRDALPEDEVLKFFEHGVLKTPMEMAVCSAMFLSGLRRSEVFALKPEDLDWHTPKIIVCRAWQNFDSRKRALGPPKGKRSRIAPFDKVLQKAIEKLWAENGKHEFVFSYKDGTTPGPSWIYGHFKKWLELAKIELKGRKIVPHSSRHSLASILEERGVSLRYIQDLLGHVNLKTTKIYLHSTEKTIREIGVKIDAVMEAPHEEPENTNIIQITKAG